MWKTVIKINKHDKMIWKLLRTYYRNCMSMLRLCKKFPPKAKQSTGVSTAWIHPGRQKCKHCSVQICLTINSVKRVFQCPAKQVNKFRFTCRDEQGISLFDRALVTHINLVSKEHFVLVRRRTPPLKKRQVCRGGRNQVKDFLALERHSDNVS